MARTNVTQPCLSLSLRTCVYACVHACVRACVLPPPPPLWVAGGFENAWIYYGLPPGYPPGTPGVPPASRGCPRGTMPGRCRVTELRGQCGSFESRMLCSLTSGGLKEKNGFPPIPPSLPLVLIYLLLATAETAVARSRCIRNKGREGGK